VGKESIRELVEVDSSVSGTVVSCDEKFDFLVSWEHVNGIESGSELVGINLSVVWDIEDVESVSQVEVVLLGKGDLGGFKLLLLVAEILKTVDQLIFVVDSEDWLSGWGSS